MSGAARASATRRSGSVFTDERAAFIAPRVRMCRTSARVSTSVMPTISRCRRYASRVRLARQLLASRAGRADDEAGHPAALRLVVLVVGAGVADVRLRHHRDLAVVGRIGEHFLVAGHAGVEDQLAGALADGAECQTGPECAVGQGQQSRSSGANCQIAGSRGRLYHQAHSHRKTTVRVVCARRFVDSPSALCYTACR